LGVLIDQVAVMSPAAPVANVKYIPQSLVSGEVTVSGDVHCEVPTVEVSGVPVGTAMLYSGSERNASAPLACTS
jgi:formylmethanofuran dehydrogenase subunit C